jgi:RNA-directed DNA polymerase
VEGRRPAKENTEQTTSPRTQRPTRESRGLPGVREVARREKRTRFTALLHHVTVGQLRDSFFALRRTAAPGIDGVTWQEYETDLDRRLVALHQHVHQGTYRAQPSKRAYLLKPDGRQRPLGLAAMDDKVVQHAVGAVLNGIYEEDFLGFSYGFRPGRSPHRALDALWVGLMRKRVNWVLDADIRGFFDTIDHGWMLKVLEHRLADRRVLRLIRKWLRAGVSDHGEWTKTEVGTPQGAVISPLLANVYLHYVFDRWAQHWRTHRARGDMVLVRYADDIVVGFEHRAEAEQFLRDWQARLTQFGLALHPDKTRLIEFGRSATANRKARGEARGNRRRSTFWGLPTCVARPGKPVASSSSARPSVRGSPRNCKTSKETLRRRWHEPVAATGEWLKVVIRGHFNYYAVPGNMDSLNSFRTQALWRWYRALRRRSQRRRLTRARFLRLVDRHIPSARILHSHPNLRFDAMHPR